MTQKLLLLLTVLTMLHGPVPADADTGNKKDKLATFNDALSQKVIEITNTRYNDNCFWGGPKGLDYGLLPGAQPIQQPVLYPDQGSTYFVGQFHLLPGQKLEITGQYPHERYFSFTVAHNLPNGGLGGGDYLRDDQIDPDPGSTNPFVPTNRRDVSPRNYTLHIVQGNPPENPADRPSNTVYTSSNSPETLIHLAMRNYIPDEGYDGTGNATLLEENPTALPQVKLIQPRGKGPSLTGEAMCKAVRATKNAESKNFTVTMWDELVAFSGDPTSAPAKPTPVWEYFWSIQYSVTGLFIPNQVERVSLFPPSDAGGFAQNPDTGFLSAMYSLEYGSVYVIRGKMPSHQKTKLGNPNWTPDTQVRYWSTCTGATPPSGAGWDCVWDQAVPVDEDGYYTLVVSRPEDRPANARRECGFKWMDFGKGEGDFLGARPWVNVAYMRFMDPNPDWAQSPKNIPLPTATNPYPQDQYVMKEYFPSSHYETKAEFESHGCPTPVQ